MSILSNNSLNSQPTPKESKTNLVKGDTYQKSSKPAIGSELGQDSVQLQTNETADILSTAKLNQQSLNKERQANQNKASNAVTKVNSTQMATASQANSEIKSQVEKQFSRKIKISDSQEDLSGSNISDKSGCCRACNGKGCSSCKPELFQTKTSLPGVCRVCKGTGCSICRPGFIEAISDSNKVEKAYEINDHRKRLSKLERIKQMIEKLIKVSKPDEISEDIQVDRNNRSKSRHIPKDSRKSTIKTYAEDQ